MTTTLTEMNNALLSLRDTISSRMGDFPPMSSLTRAHAIFVRIAEIFQTETALPPPAPSSIAYDEAYDRLVEATHAVVAAGYAGSVGFDAAIDQAWAAVELAWHAVQAAHAA